MAKQDSPPTARSGSVSGVDWDFADAPVSRGLHGIHPYPAKFIPEIPRKLIEILTPPDGCVLLDPFCGSGTALLEAILSGIDAFGIDLHPLACLISQVKTRPLNKPLYPLAQQVAAAAQKSLDAGDISIPEIPRLQHWFKPEAQRAIAAILASINGVRDTKMRDALKVSLSRIIVRVSNQESDTRYAAIDKEVSVEIVLKEFLRACAIVAQALEHLSGDLFRKLGKATVLNRNILEVGPDELPKNVGLVVTSPPYPNAYEYWLYHKYRMYWLGMDPVMVREKEIGARPHYFKKNNQTEVDFERQMSECFCLLHKILLPEGHVCFLVGSSTIHGRLIDNVAILRRAAESNGFQTQEVVERHIPRTRKKFNPVHGSIEKEYLVLFSQHS